ncbi:MAG: hypothetical protein QOD78_1671, partial [Chloroflexota bacterium]|nr:hypothetical protein [Chloroflexota bacterium]
MVARHPDLFHGTPRAEMERAIDELKGRAATATDDELMVGVAHIVALVSAGGRDAHTGLYPWSPDSRYPVHSLPLRLWLFPDGIHVVDALAPYEELIGGRIDTIADHPIDDVLAALDPLIPRDNDATVRLLTPRYILMPEVLHGLGLADDVGPVTLGIVDQAGKAQDVAVTPIPMADYNGWAGPYGLHIPADPDVLYLSRMDEPLWWSRLDDGTTLFVQYNRVDILEGSFLRELMDEAAAPDVGRVVVDIRHNFGGEVQALSPILTAIATPANAASGRLFLVTGRNTFSAASMFAAMLQARTNLTIVGEPMGGSPNMWGNNRDIELDHSGLVVSVATSFELATTQGDQRTTIDPDLPVPLTFRDWSS